MDISWVSVPGNTCDNAALERHIRRVVEDDGVLLVPSSSHSAREGEEVGYCVQVALDMLREAKQQLGSSTRSIPRVSQLSAGLLGLPPT